MNNYLLALLRIYFIVIFLTTLSVATLPFWQQFSFLALPKYILLFLPRWWLLSALLLLLFFWRCLTKPQRLLVPVLIFVSLNYLDFQLPNFAKPISQNGKNIKIVTANMGEGSKIYNLKLLIKYYQPDVLLLQEISSTYLQDVFNSYLMSECVSGLCIASNIPFKQIKVLDRKMFGGWGNFAAIYQLESNEGHINLANVHFDTPRHALLAFIKAKGMSLFSMDFDENRKIEASLVNSFMSSLNNVVVAGDFNMPVDENIYQDNFSWLTNAIDEYGTGVNNTKYINWKGYSLFGLRIDHILYSDDICVNEVIVLESLGGDHRPIMATLRIVN